MKDQRIVPYIPDRNMTEAAGIYVPPETFVQAYQAALDVAPAPEPIGEGTLTDRQRDALAFLVQYFQDNKRSPTFDEIAAGLGIDKSAVNPHLVALRKKGFISYTSKKRSIKIKPKTFDARK